MTMMTSALTAPPGTMPAVVIVTLNWNRADDTINCVRSLLALYYPDVRIIVCDNASDTGSVEAIRAWANQSQLLMHEYGAASMQPATAGSDGFSLVHTGANLGYAGGINAGIRHALAHFDFDYLWVLNNDTEVAPDALLRLVEHMRADPAIGICGATLLYYSQRDKVQAWGGASYEPWRARSRALGAFTHADAVPADGAVIEAQMAYVIGAAMLVSRRYLDEVGLMDETYFLYSEEHDWAARGKSRFKLGYAPRARVFHRHGATIGTAPDGGSTLSLFYLYRSKLMFVARHDRCWLPTALPALLWEALKLALKGKPHKCIAAVRGMCSAAQTGTCHDQ